LTGSGSGCFVEFATCEAAEAARAALPTGLRAWIARGATRSPLRAALESWRASAGGPGTD
jgi:4-diphosphocytidyl-2-C-methyl-D-erythritol kinase